MMEKFIKPRSVEQKEGKTEEEILNTVYELQENDEKKFSDFASKTEVLYGKKPEDIFALNKFFKQKEIQKVKNEINPLEFSSQNGGLYDPKLVNDHLEIARKRRKKFDQIDRAKIESFIEHNQVNLAKEFFKKQLLAQSFEDVLPCLVNKYALFGEHTNAYKTCDYDDMENGIDMILEYSDDNKDKNGVIANSYAGVGIDLCIGNTETVESKVNNIRNKLWRDESYKVDYFKSKSGYMGGLNNLARVVVSGSTNTALMLSEAYMHNEKNGTKRDIQNYRFMTQSLEEILLQIKYYKKETDDQNILNQYNLIQHNTEKVLAQRIKKMGEEKYLQLRQSYDRGYYALKDALEESYNSEN
ncbi:hypothetical protein CSB11_01835 [Candidatus Campbellbacteria bacterium]|nr:MAG: hypothetical protein CSB11_01835 [Candidatus Campbellbacteria bacterium]